MSLAALMITLSAIALTSCSKKDNEPENVVTPEVVTPEPGTHVETLTIAFPNQEQTRVAIDSDNNLTGWELGDEVTLVKTTFETERQDFMSETVFIVEGAYTFTCTNAANGTFTGTLPVGTYVNDCQLAFYNATDFDTERTCRLYFSPKTRASQNMKDVVMMVAKNDGDGNFEMEILGSILKVSNYTGADITASVKYRISGADYGWCEYYLNNQIYCDDQGNYDDRFEVNIHANRKNAFTLSSTAPTYVYIPVHDEANYAVGLSAENDAADECSIVPFKTNPAKAKLFKAYLGTYARWENPQLFDKRSFKNIVIETGVDVSSYTEEDYVHYALNAAGTLWEFLDNDVLRIQTSADKIIGPNSFDDGNGGKQGLFQGYTGVRSITGLENLDMSEVTDMSKMFENCYYLSDLDLSCWTISKVTNLSKIFRNCSLLTNLTLGDWNTSMVTDMSGVFEGCNMLYTPDLSNWDTHNVTDMSSMFSDCWRMQSDLNSWNTSNVTNMNSMFAGCRYLQTLDLSNFDTSNVQDMTYMFATCTGLQALNLSNFDTSNVQEMNYMFVTCSHLQSLTLSENFHPNDNMRGIFQSCHERLKVFDARQDFVEAIITNVQGTGWGWYMSFDGYNTVYPSL